MTIASTAAAVEKGVEAFASVEPTIATVTGMFVPGAAPIMALVQPWAPVALNFLERALNDIASSNNSDLFGSFVELLQHISKGGPNSPALAPSPTPVTPIAQTAAQAESA
jgi:hypothetical protein